MTVTAVMRPFGRQADETPLEVVDLEPGLVAVAIPGFGHLLVGQMTSNEVLDRLVPQWRALLLQPGGNKLRRDVTVHDDDRLEVEVVPNPSQEPRLVVIVTGLQRQQGP